MCLFTLQDNPIITTEPIKSYKLIKKVGSGDFASYFNYGNIEFGKVIKNDFPIGISKSVAAPYPYLYEVLYGIFHTFENFEPIKHCFEATSNPDIVYVCKALIPIGSKLFVGISHSFKSFSEITYGSDQIEYFDPKPITEYFRH